MLIDNLDILWNNDNTNFKVCICLISGFTKKRKSYAYNKQGLMSLKGSFQVPCSTSLVILLEIKSIANMNSNGDMGSPCLASLFKFIIFPNRPLIIIWKQLVSTQLCIHLIHFLGKPIAAITLIRNSQLNVSKAL